MPIVNRPDKTPEFVPAGDDFLSDYISEINQPKQEQSRPEIPDDSEFTDLEELTEEKAPSQYAQKRGKTTARFAVTTLDKILSSMVAVYAHSENPEEFKADPEDVDDLTDQLGVYFTENNLDLPPWVFALITAAFIVQKKFKGVGSMRAINIERKKFKIENESLKIQIETLEAKNKMLELRKTVEKLEAATE